MKGKLLIVFHSNHGYVKRYVDILGNEFGCDAVPAGKLKSDMLAGYDRILYIGSIKNGEINGFRKFSDYLDAIYQKLVVCGVGVAPFCDFLPARIKSTAISIAYEKFVPVFYAQGGFDVNELSRFEKFAVAWRIRQLKLAQVVDEYDSFIIKAVDEPVDEVSRDNIRPLIDFLDGKPVDEKLYSPAEITDPEEQKRFFEELEKAADAPADPKRALRKKLKRSDFGQIAEPEADEPPAPEEPAQDSAQPDEQPEKTEPAEG